MGIAHLMREIVRSTVGIDVKRDTVMNNEFLRLVRILRQRNIQFVLDVGANDGGYGSDLMRSGFTGRMLSFEPLPEARTRLNRKSETWGPRWTIAPPFALSDRDGNAVFNVAGNSVSSSLLTMTSAHTHAAPNSVTAGHISVRTRRLDNYWPCLDTDEVVFMKVDTQGAERMVLEGAGELLKGPIVGLQLEMSLTALYDAQMLALELDSYVRSLGFKIWDFIPGFRDPTSLQLLQYDGVYFRD